MKSRNTGEMTRSQQSTLLLVLAFMVVAVLVPALALGRPRPARFGWQMYSVAQPAPRAWLEAEDGKFAAVDLGTRLAVLRADIPDPRSLGKRLCAQESAKAVLVELHTTDLVRVPCN